MTDQKLIEAKPGKIYAYTYWQTTYKRPADRNCIRFAVFRLRQIGAISQKQITKQRAIQISGAK